MHLLVSALIVIAAPIALPDVEAIAYRIADGRLVAADDNGTRGEAPLPCPASALVREADQVFLACGDRGVAVFDVSDPATPRLLTLRDLGGTVSGFHEVGGRVWAEVTRIEARLLGTLPASDASTVATAPRATALSVKSPPPADDTPSQVSPAVAAVGEVSELKPEGVVITLGMRDGLERGDRVEIFAQREVVLASGEVGAIEEDRLVVGEISAVSEGHAQVTLGRNETVPKGAKARPTRERITGSRWLPPRAGELWSVSFSLRPFFTLGSVGAGTVSDAAVGYRMQAPVHIQAVIEPLGVGFADEGNVLATAGNVIMSYDTRYFEVGLGAGWSAVNNELRDTDKVSVPAADSGVGDIEAQVKNVDYGFSIAQLARLGSEDGLNLTARNTFIHYGDELHYGGTVGQLSVPIDGSSWLLGRGGGGASGYGFGELGLRLLLTGNGREESVFVTASLGGAGLFGDVKVSTKKCEEHGVGGSFHWGKGQKTCYKEVGYAGPMVGLGIEWRP